MSEPTPNPPASLLDAAQRAATALERIADLLGQDVSSPDYNADVSYRGEQPDRL